MSETSHQNHDYKAIGVPVLSGWVSFVMRWLKPTLPEASTESDGNDETNETNEATS